MPNQNLHQQQTADREARTNAIIEADPQTHKIIVAGPGTGKSFTFRKVLENRARNRAGKISGDQNVFQGVYCRRRSPRYYQAKPAG